MTADVLEIYLADIRRLFNSMDPAPFHERDLDPNAADYILEWAEELPRKGPLALVVKLGKPLGVEDNATAADLLGADRIGIEVSEDTGWQFHPEQTTSALISPHPAAKYFVAR